MTISDRLQCRTRSSISASSLDASRRRFAQAIAATTIGLATPGLVVARSNAWAERTGFNVVTWGHRPWSFAELATALERLRAFGGRRITLVTFRYVDSQRGSVKREADFDLPPAPSDALIADTLAYARELGFATSLNALVEIGDPEGIGYRWRGDLSFRNTARRRFFDEYGRYQREMARIATRHGAERLFVGSELKALTTDPALQTDWIATIRDIRDVISDVAGASRLRLSYSANFSEYRDISFWPHLDEIAVSAYFPLVAAQAARGPDRPSIDRVRRGWLAELATMRKFAYRLGMPLAVSEWGLTPFDLVTATPWALNDSEARDPGERVAAFQAVLSSLHREGNWLAGFDLWHWYVGSDSGPFAIRSGTIVADIVRRRLLSAV